MVPFMAYTREREESEIEREFWEGFNRQLEEVHAKHGLKGAIAYAIIWLLMMLAIIGGIFLGLFALIRLIFG